MTGNLYNFTFSQTTEIYDFIFLNVQISDFLT
jgi:hypothetical protein